MISLAQVNDASQHDSPGTQTLRLIGTMSMTGGITARTVPVKDTATETRAQRRSDSDLPMTQRRAAAPAKPRLPDSRLTQGAAYIDQQADMRAFLAPSDKAPVGTVGILQYLWRHTARNMDELGPDERQGWVLTGKSSYVKIASENEVSLKHAKRVIAWLDRHDWLEKLTDHYDANTMYLRVRMDMESHVARQSRRSGTSVLTDPRLGSHRPEARVSQTRGSGLTDPTVQGPVPGEKQRSSPRGRDDESEGLGGQSQDRGGKTPHTPQQTRGTRDTGRAASDYGAAVCRALSECLPEGESLRPTAKLSAAWDLLARLWPDAQDVPAESIVFGYLSDSAYTGDTPVGSEAAVLARSLASASEADIRSWVERGAQRLAEMDAAEREREAGAAEAQERRAEILALFTGSGHARRVRKPGAFREGVPDPFEDAIRVWHHKSGWAFASSNPDLNVGDGWTYGYTRRDSWDAAAPVELD